VPRLSGGGEQGEDEGGGKGEDDDDDVMGSTQALILDVPRIVYSFSSDEESDGEGESVLQLEARYLKMMKT